MKNIQPEVIDRIEKKILDIIQSVGDATLCSPRASVLETVSNSHYYNNSVEKSPQHTTYPKFSKSPMINESKFKSRHMRNSLSGSLEATPHSSSKKIPTNEQIIMNLRRSKMSIGSSKSPDSGMPTLRSNLPNIQFTNVKKKYPKYQYFKNTGNRNTVDDEPTRSSSQ